MRKLIIQIAIGIAAAWFASEFVKGVIIEDGAKNLIIVGTVLGLINFFAKPVLNLIALPLRLLTLGIFGVIINMFLIWLVDVVMTDKFEIIGLIPLFWTTLIVWGLSVIVPIMIVKRLPWKRRKKRAEAQTG